MGTIVVAWYMLLTWLNISTKYINLRRALLVQCGLEAHILGLQNVKLQLLFAAF